MVKFRGIYYLDTGVIRLTSEIVKASAGAVIKMSQRLKLRSKGYRLSETQKSGVFNNG